MQALLVCSTFFLAADAAQSASLRSLGFLLGQWTSDNQAETTEFHWDQSRGSTILLGRHWTGDDSACPWCATQAAMVAYRDIESNQVHVRFVDRSRGVMHFRLVSSADKSADFLMEPNRAARRLTFHLSPQDVLTITLEQADSDGRNAFSTISRWTLHRRSLILRPNM